MGLNQLYLLTHALADPLTSFFYTLCTFLESGSFPPLKPLDFYTSLHTPGILMTVNLEGLITFRHRTNPFLGICWFNHHKSSISMCCYYTDFTDEETEV